MINCFGLGLVRTSRPTKHALSLSLGLLVSQSVCLSASLSLSHTQPLSLSLSHTHNHSLSLSLSLTHTTTLSLSHTHTHTHTQPLSLSLSLSNPHQDVSIHSTLTALLRRLHRTRRNMSCAQGKVKWSISPRPTMTAYTDCSNTQRCLCTCRTVLNYTASRVIKGCVHASDPQRERERERQEREERRHE